MARTFGDLLRVHRAAAGLSQAGLADRAGISAQAVGSLERGRRTRPRRHTVMSLANALGLEGNSRAELLRAAATRAGRRAPSTTVDMVSTQLIPRSLPPAVGDFTGREWQVKQLRDLIATGSQAAAPSVVVSAIEGMGGVGKTALAVHVAHELAGEFPDGQLYVDLRGFGPGEPMTTTDALGLLLKSLGVSVTDVSGVDYAVSRYRSAIAGKRILVLLDNAADVEQVMALLPGTAGCAAIVTSRRSLSTLPGACHLQLDILPEDEAVELLCAIAGEGRVLAEIDAGHDVVRRCGHLPLAIRMAGARLLARPSWPLSVLADELSDERRRLDILEQQDVGVRVSFAVSLRQLADSDDPLDQAAAAAFPLMGLPDGPDSSLAVVARLLDRSETDIPRVLDRLVDAYLLATHRPGRYRLHDLLRTYARETAESAVPETERAAALTRVLVFYNSIAWRAHELWKPGDRRRLLANETWLLPLPDLTDKHDVLNWLDDDRSHIISVMRQALAMPAMPRAVISQLSMALIGYYWVRQHWADLHETSRLALLAAEISGDQVAQGFARNDHAAALAELGHLTQATEEMRHSVDLFQHAGQEHGEARAMANLAYLLFRLERLDEGLVVAERALELNQALRDDQRIGQSWLVLGLLHSQRGDLARGMSCFERSRERYRAIGSDRGLADACHQIGLALYRSGFFEDGLRAFADALPLDEQLGLHGSVAEAHLGMADIYLELGRYADAACSAEAALAVALGTTNPYAEAQARSVLGSALAGCGRHREARAEWERALPIFVAIGSAKAEEIRALLAED